GEWATREGSPTPNMNAALGDAAFMTGMERNSDLIIMHAYAPLFVNVSDPNGAGSNRSMQWQTDLIGYNALTSYGSPSYYAQGLSSQTRGDTALPVDISFTDNPYVPPVPHGSVGVATWNTSAEYKDIKVTDGDKVLYQSDFAKGTEGWRSSQGSRWVA